MKDIRQNLNQTQLKKLKNMDKQLIWGLKHKKVFPYPDALFDRLRPYSWGGFPVSIALFVNELCNGFCYDRANMMQLAFNDCKVVHADIETLRITTGGNEYAEHAFVITPEFGGNREWVVDTSAGLIYDKDFYFKLEKPKINLILSKEDCMKFRDTKELIVNNFEEEKYVLPLTLPLVENAIKNSIWLGTVGYREKTLAEIEIFKKSIGYDEIAKEIEDDMKLMRTNPQKLDEKFGIVRDRYGREISRNGKPNPYYISPEESDAMQARIDLIGENEEQLSIFWNEQLAKSIERWEKEDAELSELSKVRLEQIMQNPTANFYDTKSQPGNN